MSSVSGRTALDRFTGKIELIFQKSHFRIFGRSVDIDLVTNIIGRSSIPIISVHADRFAMLRSLQKKSQPFENSALCQNFTTTEFVRIWKSKYARFGSCSVSGCIFASFQAFLDRKKVPWTSRFLLSEIVLRIL